MSAITRLSGLVTTIMVVAAVTLGSFGARAAGGQSPAFAAAAQGQAHV